MIILIGCFGLLGLLGFYCWWQYIFHIASNNDVRRRDFHLKKAELILHHMSQNSDSKFVPSSTKTVIINLAAGLNDEMTEVELFNQKEPDIHIPSGKIGTPPPKLYRNQHILVSLAGPTFLTCSLIVVLFIKADVIGNIIEILTELVIMNVENRTIFEGDNLHILRGLDSETIDLIYLDPPFNSNRTYFDTLKFVKLFGSFQGQDLIKELNNDTYRQTLHRNAS